MAKNKISPNLNSEDILKTKNSKLIKLTQTVQKGGCAAKVAAHELRGILDRVHFPKSPPELLVGAGTFDDAAIFDVRKLLENQKTSLVQTLDFFTPIVDSPHLFGAIAATNALSDVYAMGGDPITALGILAFPLGTLETDIAVEVLQGACDILQIADVPLVGGHSIDDETLKFGLSVTGVVNPLRMWTNAGARPGDHIILTKALGTGTLTAGLKRQELTEEDLFEAFLSMKQLNRIKSEIPDEETLLSIRAATDITGFGLAGHAMQMAKASGVSLEIQIDKVPVFSKTFEALEKGFLTKAHRTNQEYTVKNSSFDQVSDMQKNLIYDPQTSGGLLLSVDSQFSDKLVSYLKKNFPATGIIGKVLKKHEMDLIWRA
jgi:selenide, water dikinase